MRYIKTYEDNLPFDIELIPVMWNGFYKYNGDLHRLEVGDYTDKGIIIERIPSDRRSDLSYRTAEGKFLANKFLVYCGNYFKIKEYIEMKNDMKKYNL